MPVLTKIEAKSPKGKLFHLAIIVALFVGSVTMIYPFLLMFSSAMRSKMDEKDMSIVPVFLKDDDELNRKFLETKYDFNFVTARNYRRVGKGIDFKNIAIPAKANKSLAAEWTKFIKKNKLPNHWQVLGGTLHYGPVVSQVYDIYLKRVKKAYNNDLKSLCEELGIPFAVWDEFDWGIPLWTSTRYSVMKSKAMDEYIKLMNELPLAYRSPINLTTTFLTNVIFIKYGNTNVTKYNLAHKIKIKNYDEFQLPQKIPPKTQPCLREEWKDFVFNSINVSFVRSDASDEEYQSYLKKTYKSIDKLNHYRIGFEVKDFTDISLPKDDEWITSTIRFDYENFLKQIDIERIYLVGPEFMWQKYLARKYKSVKQLNSALNTNYMAIKDCTMPISHIEKLYVDSHKSELRKRYALRNFKVVWKGAVSQGPAVKNTLLYVFYALLFALTVQPLAAYALSRYQPRGMWKILFIFVATMAFPPMVTTIPMFLIYKKLHLINTIVGLALPVCINGYLLFLLIGFFDSLPKHFYEAATIDGASEFRMFWQITMMMSKPILAVVALQTFIGVWASFMMPLIFAPAEEKQVLAVWVHQFQLDAPTSAVFACILIASIPTMVIFMFAQRTIMRGIAVPSEK